MPTAAMVVYWRLQIGLRALAHRRRNLLHFLAAGIGLHHRARGPDGIDDRQNAAQNDEPQGFHCNVPGCLEGPGMKPARKEGAPRDYARVLRKSARTLP